MFVAIMGYGTVGSGVAQVIADNNENIAKKSAQDIFDVKYILDTYGEKVGQYVIDNNIDPFLVHLYNQNPIDITRAMTFNRVVKNRYIHIKKGTTEYYQYIKSKKKK